MLDRYSRQILFSGIGRKGQEAIARGFVTVIGCGALGTVSSELLVRAGVGRVRIIDRDFVEGSNLQRQSLFTESDAQQNLPKVVAAEKALSCINSEVEIEALLEDVTFENIADLVAGSDVIIDGSDNFEVRFLINDYCVKEGLPWVYGAALGSYGISFGVRPGVSACLRCIFSDPPAAGTAETCESAGIIAPVVHIVASNQVTEALQLLVGAPAKNQILHFDVWKGDWRGVAIPAASSSCPCCGEGRFEFLEGKQWAATDRLCGRNAVQVHPQGRSSINLQELASRLSRSFRVSVNEYLLRAEIDSYELAIFKDGRAIIRGTDDSALARTIYSKYVGN